MKVKKGKYQHFKGNYYMVMGVAHHSETLEEMVIYKALYESPEYGRDAIWVRPAKMFLEKVMVGGKRVPRFKFCYNQES